MPYLFIGLCLSVMFVMLSVIVSSIENRRIDFGKVVFFHCLDFCFCAQKYILSESLFSTTFIYLDPNYNWHYLYIHLLFIISFIVILSFIICIIYYLLSLSFVIICHFISLIIYIFIVLFIYSYILDPNCNWHYSLASSCCIHYIWNDWFSSSGNLSDSNGHTISDPRHRYAANNFKSVVLTLIEFWILFLF